MPITVTATMTARCGSAGRGRRTEPAGFGGAAAALKNIETNCYAYMWQPYHCTGSLLGGKE